jgi:hypothetical protein
LQKENKNNSNMTTAELDSHKMILVREIINHFNTEESLQKLAEACSIIRKEEEDSSSYEFPPQLFQELTETVERQYEAGQCLTDEQLDKVIQAW